MTNEQTIWSILIGEIKNPYGVAGLMGNLFAESSLSPVCKTGGDKEVKGKAYAELVDSGKLSRDAFSKDGVAFGIAQWRYWSRKEQLWIFAGVEKKSIGDLEMQTKFLLKEIKTYKTVWETLLNAKSVKEASDMVLERYEKPANVSEATKEKRASYGLKYFSTYISDVNDVNVRPAKPVVVTTVDNVNFRCGNGKNYTILGRVNIKGTKHKYVATASNGWHAIEVLVKNKNQVAWICGDYCEVKT